MAHVSGPGTWVNCRFKVGLGHIFIIHTTLLSLWRLAAFGDFRKKKRLNARDFAREYLALVMVTDLVESSKDTASLLVWTRKQLFCLWDAVFL